ncbi:hypothetical protein GEMRC1_013570 [Eukaryota sp. GEM-RC1]
MSSSFGFSSSKVLSDLLFNEELSDQQLLFNEELFHVNRNVLALNCKFFHDMWYMEFKDKHETSLDLSNLPVSASSLITFLRSLYGQDANITVESAYDIFYLSHYFKCDILSFQITSALNSSLLDTQYLSNFISNANKIDDLRALLFAGPFLQKVSSFPPLCLSTSFLVSLNENEFCGSKESLCWFVKSLVKSIEEDSFDCSELEGVLNKVKIDLIEWNDWNDLLLSPLEVFGNCKEILMKFHSERLRKHFFDQLVSDNQNTQKINAEIQQKLDSLLLEKQKIETINMEIQHKLDCLLKENEALTFNQSKKDNEQLITISSSTPMSFAPLYSHSDIVISNSGKRISFRGSHGYRSILGDKPLVKGGVYKWKVRYQSNWVVSIGIVPLQNFNSSLDMSDMTNSKYIWSDNYKGNLSGSFSKWKTGDVLELTADMQNNTFSIKEINSGYIDMSTHFDEVDDDYYPVFRIFGSCSVIEIVD